MSLFSNRYDEVTTVGNEFLTPISAGLVELPFRYRPRPYQADLVNEFFDMLEGKSSTKYYALEWCRRAGKDTTFFQLVVAAAAQVVGDYAYMLPLNAQAKKVILNGTVMDSDGRVCKMLDFIPPALMPRINFSEGIIKLGNGSNIYVMGSNNYDSSVGMNLKGCVFSEWSICDPKSFDYFRPMLEETARQDSAAGWALFCWTPRSRNWAWDTRNTAQMEANKDYWYFSSKTILELTDENHNYLYTQADIDKWIERGADPDLIQQEMFLDYNAIVKGIIYSKQMAQAREEGRVTKVSIDITKPVITFWDIGMGDATTIWFMQTVDYLDKKDYGLNLIGYYENNNEGLDHYVAYMSTFAKTHGIKYGTVYFPHDGKNQEFIAGERRFAAMIKHGFDVHCIARTTDIEEAIRQTKRLFHRFRFDESRCTLGISCLDSYKRKISKDGVTAGTPLHDWSSNGADALRQIGQYWTDRYTDNALSLEQELRLAEQDRFSSMNDELYSSDEDYYEDLYA